MARWREAAWLQGRGGNRRDRRLPVWLRCDRARRLRSSICARHRRVSERRRYPRVPRAAQSACVARHLRTPARSDAARPVATPRRLSRAGRTASAGERAATRRNTTMNASTDPRDIAATPPARATFPFAALIGQDALQQALLLAAIDPGLGGVLVSGPRGTAKSTAARALAELLPEGQLVTLPLGASEERLIGTLDIETVLRDGSVKFSPGLLAKAHRGVLYVDEINLLPDALVDALLDAAASGGNSVERDRISHSHEASLVLICTMNSGGG